MIVIVLAFLGTGHPLAEQDMNENSDFESSFNFEHGICSYLTMSVLTMSRDVPASVGWGEKKAYSWKVPQLPAGTDVAWNELQPAGFPWRTTASNQSFNIKLSLGQAQGKLEMSSGRYTDEHHLHKAGTAAFPVGLYRWKTNEDDLRGLSLMGSGR